MVSVGLTEVVGDKVEGVFVGGLGDVGAVGLEAVEEVHVVGLVDYYLVAFDGAVLGELDFLLEDVGTGGYGVVEDDGAVVFECGVDDGELDEVVEPTAAFAVGGQLLDKGALGGLDAGAVFANGVTFVDGEALEGGVIDDEGLAFVGVGGDGAVAEECELFAVVVFGGAVATDGVALADEFVYGIGFFGGLGLQGIVGWGLKTEDCQEN